MVRVSRYGRSSGGTPSRSAMVAIGICSATSRAKSTVPRSTASATSRSVRRRTPATTPASARGANGLSSRLRISRCRRPSVTASIFPPAESPPASSVASTLPFSEVNRSLSR